MKQRILSRMVLDPHTQNVLSERKSDNFYEEISSSSERTLLILKYGRQGYMQVMERRQQTLHQQQQRQKEQQQRQQQLRRGITKVKSKPITKDERMTSHSRRYVHLDQNVIDVVVANAKKRVLDPPLRVSTHNAPKWAVMLVEYSQKRKAINRDVDCLFCYSCLKPIKRGTWCLSMARKGGRKHYHKTCAKRLNIT